MKNSMLLAACASVALFATVAIGEVAPTDVVFSDTGAVEGSLTGVAGDPTNGAMVFKNRKKGNCLACHSNSDMSDQQFHGEIGPSLDGAGSNWSEAELRGLLTNSKNTFDGTMMPAFYVDSGFFRVMSKFEGRTNLTAQEVEDVLAYIQTLTE
ncbi:MAG: sulfur oxidation c-type cytochrome SoxX [Rhodobacteraceae bacterium]|nr:sulfur oxidation c-type cytochrome SoxX [Paracoccaceae bacterium]